MNKLIFALIAGVAAVGTAQAQTAAPKAYVGVGVTATDTDFRAVGGGDSGYKGSGKLFAGYEFNDRFGVEAGYTDLRSSDTTFFFDGAPQHLSTDGHRRYLAGKATLPVNEQVSVYGKLGVGYSKIKTSYTGAGNGWEDSKTEAYGAVGAQYKISQNVALIAEYERYGKQKDFGHKADALSIGAKYAF